jgi:hypothetical protein
MSQGTTKRPDIEKALRVMFGEEFYLTNFNEAWKQNSPKRARRPSGDLVNNPSKNPAIIGFDPNIFDHVRSSDTAQLRIAECANI